MSFSVFPKRGLFRGPVAFLDEVEKGSDAAQGLVLSALAERVLMDGAREIKIPLESAIATQNDEIAVAATADRFAFALTLPDQTNDLEFSKFGARLSVNPPPYAELVSG